jgi:hypothetical protein
MSKCFKWVLTKQIVGWGVERSRSELCPIVGLDLYGVQVQPVNSSYLTAIFLSGSLLKQQIFNLDVFSCII